MKNLTRRLIDIESEMATAFVKYVTARYFQD